MFEDLGNYPFILSAVITGGIILYALHKRSFDPFDPFYLVAVLYLFTFIVRPVSLEYGMTGYLKDNIPWNFVQEAMLYGCFSFILFLTGYMFAGIKWFRGSHTFLYTDILNPRRIVLTKLNLLILLVFFSCVAVLLVVTHGGISNVLENRATVYRGAGMYVSMLYLGLIVYLFIYALWVNKQIKGITVIMAFFLVVALLMVSTGERLRVLEMLLGMLIISHYMKSRFSLTKSLLSLFILVIAITALLFFRRVYSHGAVGDEIMMEVLESFSRNFLLFDGFVATLQKVPSEIDFSYGTGYLMMFVGLIPRVIWPGKPEWGKSIFTEQVFGVSDSVFTYGIVGEFWWNFGFSGIIFGSFLFGFALGKLYHYLRKNEHDAAKVILYYLLMTSLVLRGYKGGIESAFMEIVVKMAMFIPAVYFISGFRFFILNRKSRPLHD